MPTKDEIREFLETHAPGKPEITELSLSDSFWMEWGEGDVSMSLRGDGCVTIRNSMIGRNPDQAREFGTLYLSVVDFADKVKKFLTTS